MNETTTVETTTEPNKEETVPKKKATKSKTATAKTSKAKAKPTKMPKPNRPPKEDLVVFACRVAADERVKFHEATGPAGATRFARKLMVVFAAEDEAGFRSLLKEARELRG